jgi:hypothetical protein
MRKGQVTIFIIVGVVLVLVAGLFIIFRKDIAQGNNPDIPQVTHDFSQIESAYEVAAANCLESEGRIVLKEIFAHGGFYNPEDNGFVAVSVLPTAGSALDVGGGFLVPYWWELQNGAGCRNNCGFKMSVPPLTRTEGGSLPSVEEQMMSFMVPSVKSCLDKLSFSEDYDVTMADELSVDVSIADGSIAYGLERKVEFVFVPTEAVKTVSQVTAKDDVEAKALYENAKSLLQYEFLVNKSDTMPYLIKTVIQAYGMGSSLPPMMGGTKFESGTPKMWFLPDVKEELQYRLADNIPLVQISGSSEQNLMLDPNHYSQAMYHTYSFKPDMFFPKPELIPQTSFSFIYDPSWAIDIKVSPGSFMIKPDCMSFRIPLLISLNSCDYLFSYDVVVPVMVVMSDETAFNGEGLSLLFAVETGLSDNQAFLYGDEESSKLEESVDFFADDDFYMEGYVSLTAKDLVSGNVLPDVEINYLCGAQGVFIGKTASDGFLMENYPFCLGGVIQPLLQEYYGVNNPLSIIDDEDYDVEVSLAPIKEFSMRTKGFLLAKSLSPQAVNMGLTQGYEAQLLALQLAGISSDIGVWSLGNQELYLGVDDELILIFTRQVGPSEASQVQVYNLNYQTVQNQKISLALGSYDVEALLLRRFGEGHTQNEFVIPADEVCWKENPLGDEECQTIPAIVFNTTMLVGGASLTGSYAFEMTIDDYSKDTLVVPFFMISLIDLEKHDDLGVLSEFEGYSNLYNETLTPYFH